MLWLFDWAFLAVALAGTAAAGWVDLKTTEIPDIIPLSMAIAGAIIHAARAIFIWDTTLLLTGLAVAAGFLAFGYLLYFLGQWGEADALLLGALGFLIPQPLAMFAGAGAPTYSGLIFPIALLLNLFIVGAIYSIIYAFGLAAKDGHVVGAFFKDVKKSKKGFAIIAGAITAFFVGFEAFLLLGISYAPHYELFLVYLTFLLFGVGLWFFYKFASVLEKVALRRKISVAKLKVGDVLAEDVKTKSGKISSRLYKGLTPKQIKALKAAKKEVKIKEGVRYSPVFFITVLATAIFGNILFLLIGVL